MASANSLRQRQHILHYAVIGATASAVAFCLLLSTARWFYEPGGELLQLLLMVGTISSGFLLLLTRRADVDRLPGKKSIEPFLKISLASSAVLAVGVWSPSVVFWLLLSSLILATAIGDRVLKWVGLEIRPIDQSVRSAVAVENEARVDLPTPVERETPPLIQSGVGGVHSPAETLDIGDQHVSTDDETRKIEDSLTDEGHDVSAETECDDSDPWSIVREQMVADQSLCQNITRWHAPDGSQSIVATIRCQFLARQQTEVVHLPFWPLFAQSPTIYCEQLAGPHSRIKVTENRLHGARIEIRLEKSSAREIDVVIEIIATCQSAGHPSSSLSDAAA